MKIENYYLNISLYKNIIKDKDNLITEEKLSDTKDISQSSLNNLIIHPSINNIDTFSTNKYLELKKEIANIEEDKKIDRKKDKKETSSSKNSSPLDLLYKKLKEIQRQLAQLMSKIAEVDGEEAQLLMDKIAVLNTQSSTINNQIQKVLTKKE